jgi:hypothetical protein
MMNGASTARGLCARRRRDGRDAHPRRRRHDRRQGALRIVLPVRWQPHVAGRAVHNPYKIGYSAGGSSSGCAALVGAGEVEMAIGGDQGGSIRMPGSYSAATG